MHFERPTPKNWERTDAERIKSWLDMNTPATREQACNLAYERLEGLRANVQERKAEQERLKELSADEKFKSTIEQQVPLAQAEAAVDAWYAYMLEHDLFPDTKA